MEKGTLRPEDIQEVYLIPTDFFKPDRFIERCQGELRIFRAKIRTEEKEKVKNALNAFQVACLSAPLSEEIKLETTLLFFDTLNHYAQEYASKETFRNIIKSFETQGFRAKLFARFPVKAKMIYAETLLGYHTLLKNESPISSFEKTELLIKAKSFLWKIYIHHIEGKNKLVKLDLSHCLTLLSLTLAELSRWFEPLFYLNEAKAHLLNNPNVEYTRVKVLEAIKIKTCLSYNGQLILKLIDCSLEVLKLPQLLQQQKHQLEEIVTTCRKFLAENKLKVQRLRSHKKKVSKSFNKYNPYRKYCATNQLFLNEHSFFCNCGHSTKDNLQIETSHDHTKIDWVKPFEKMIDVFCYDFILARNNYYYALPGIKVSNSQIKNISRSRARENLKNALLKNAFKTLYSVLDQVAHGIFKVMEIDFESKLREKFPIEKERPKLYFLSMWDFELLDVKLFESNYYLTSLYSIAQDLNNSKYAALKEFRTIRNAMEHKILFIVDDAKEKLSQSNDDIVYTRDELLEKTKILMLLTKSAIFSFTYLARRQSKIKNLIQAPL